MTLAQRVIDLAIQIQQIPAPTFGEGERAEFVRALFEREGLDVSIDVVGNVYGRWSMDDSQKSRVEGAALSGEAVSKGRRRRPEWRSRIEGLKVKPLIVSAHLDTVFPTDTDLRLTRRDGLIHGPGLGDNSLGVAALFGLLWYLREHSTSPRPSPREAPPQGAGRGSQEVWFVANVSEEGLGDLRGMKAVVDRFGEDVQAYLVLEGLALGHIYHRALGVKRYRITAKTPGGHSWSDYGKPSAIHELSKLVVELTSMKLPESPRTTMNVGKISGGTSINVIASEASIELDLRSEGQGQLAELVSRVEQKIREAGKPDVGFETEVIGARPAGKIPADHPLIQLAQECIREQGLEPVLTTGSTDANIPLSRGYPALVLGITTGGSAHTLNEFINTDLVEKGLVQVGRFVEKVFQ